MKGFLQIVIALLLLCGLGSAATIRVLSTDTTRGQTFYFNADGVNESGFGGVLNLRVTSNGTNYLRDSLCVDLFTNIQVGTTYNTTIVYPLAISGKHLERVSWLVDNALLPTQIPSFKSEIPQADWVTNADQGAGLQFAIWDIVHDGGDGFSAGRVRTSTSGTATPAAVLSWAQLYEALSVGKSSNLAYIYVNTSQINGVAAQMLAGPLFQDGGPGPIAPEPSTYLLVGTALIGAFWWTRRK